MFETPSKFYLPDFYNFYGLNINVLNLMREHPEWWRPMIRVGAVYGTFPSAIWNGGRVFFGFSDAQNVENTISGFNNLGIPVRFTWTNSKLVDSHVYDPFCNMVMELARLVGSKHNVINEVLVNSPILEEYLREKYPDFKYISSTTKCLNAKAFSKELASDKYSLAVLDYHLNTNKKYLQTLAEGPFPRKVEILLNAYCSEKCPSARRAAHYDQLSWCQLNFSNPDPFCTDLKQSFYECRENKTTISKNTLYYKLIPAGFRHFKIEGRTNHIVDVLDSYLYYMAMPKYEERLRNTLLKMLF